MRDEIVFRWYSHGKTRLFFLRSPKVLLSTVLAATILSGCSGSSLSNQSYLHNAEDFATATQAKEAIDKIDFLAVVNQEREIQDKILQLELDVVSDFAVARRNAEILILIDGQEFNWSKLSARVDAREKFLFGEQVPQLSNIKLEDLTQTCGGEVANPTTFDTPASWVAAQFGSLKNCRAEFTAQGKFFEAALKFKPPVCPIPGDMKPYDKLDDKQKQSFLESYNSIHPTANPAAPKTPENIKDEYDPYADKCNLMRSFERATKLMMKGCQGKQCGPAFGDDARIQGLIGGALSSSLHRLDAMVSKLNADKTAAAQAQKNYKTFLKEYQAAVKANAAKPSEQTKKDIEKASKQVGSAVKALDKVGGVFGKEILSDVQLSNIDQILTAMAAGTYDADALAEACKKEKSNACLASKAAAVAASLPVFVGRAQDISALRDAPALTPLLLEKIRLLAIQQDTKKAVTRRNREVALHQAIFDSYTAEASALNEAEQKIGEANGLMKKAETFAEAEKAATETAAKELYWRAAGLYLGTYINQRKDIHGAEYKLIALQHEAAVDRSEASLKIWGGVITTPITALLAYYEGGLKPEDIIELAKALGLTGIAVGVN